MGPGVVSVLVQRLLVVAAAAVAAGSPVGSDVVQLWAPPSSDVVQLWVDGSGVTISGGGGGGGGGGGACISSGLINFSYTNFGRSVSQNFCTCAPTLLNLRPVLKTDFVR